MMWVCSADGGGGGGGMLVNEVEVVEEWEKRGGLLISALNALTCDMDLIA